MGSGQSEREVAVGDFVEAVFVADSSVIRRGVVIQVHNQRCFTVKGRDWESLCDNPRLIPKEELSVKERDLLNWVEKSL